MIVDTSSNRREWYEADYEPDVPPTQIVQGSWIGVTRLPPPHAPLKPGDPFHNKNGDLIGFVQSVDAATGQVTLMTSKFVTHARRAGKMINLQFQLHASGLQDTLKKLASLVPSEAEKPLANETVKERALRLAKQPHSMAPHPSDFHFDVRGRRRY